MLRKRLIWQIYPQYMFVILFSLFVMSWYGSRIIRDIYLQGIVSELQSQSQLIGELLNKDLRIQNRKSIQDRCDSLTVKTMSRITVILPSGQVISDSHENPEIMDNHARRPEIAEALQGGSGHATRFSFTLDKDMMYVAVPVYHQDQIIAVVRTAKPVSLLSVVLGQLYKRIFISGLIVAILAAILNWIFSRRINRPIQKIQEGFFQFGEGNLNHQIHISKPDELKRISESMNAMASELKERMDTITLQRNELEAVLSSMIEGVLVVDPDEKILRCNHAALTMFELSGYSIEQIRGKNVQDFFRNSRLQMFIKNIIKNDGISDTEIVIHLGNDKILKAHGTPFQDLAGHRIGALVVLNDVTKTMKLETIRRDFVSNVSHELKTPITSIKGYVETLRDGAIDDKVNAKRFLNIITHHTERLNAIIEDLLNLSRIEQESDVENIELKVGSVKKICIEAIGMFREKLSENNIQIDVKCSSRIQVMMKSQLMCLALTNLINNAIKYSEPGSKIEIRAEENNDTVIIEVKDQGCGIPEDDLDRIFERFYRVDKARSRDLGGTGLGLAIVKHIVHAHRGKIEVESEPGKGSLFRIILPSIA